VVNVYKDNPSENAVMVRRVGDEGDFAHLLPPFEDRSMVLGNDGAVFYVQTNRGAPNGRIVAIDLEAGGPWRTLIPEAPQAIDNASLISDRFVLRYLVDCLPAVKIFDLSGALEREVSFPDVGTLGTRSSSFEGRRDHTETFYSFQAPARPPEIYRYDLTTGEHTLLHRAAVDIDLDRFVTRQVFFKSRDGARVPMFLTHLRGLKLDGSNPTLLMGYGGFNITYDPYFNTALLPWFELGGVLAQANLRGGSEYGEAWHRAGMREKKQNVFDDFIAAAEHLIAQGYTAPARLASRGNSNGGLLVGATMLQRPDLFGACLPATGVMDMLRYQRFTSGKYWVGEYGASSDPEMFPVLRAYSPVHNVDPEAAYPPCMVMTADTDDRVVPGHSFKFAAALQAASGGPCYLRVTTRAGHGAGMSLSQTIEEWADCLAFLVDRFGLELPEHLR
jgi:prolyl oligopeptidase